MSIPCPKCRSPLNPKGLKPGQFKPKCPKCATVFLTVVPEDPDGTILAKLIPEPAKVLATADPNATGAFTEVERHPDATGVFSESHPNASGDDPNTTGAFTEVEKNFDHTNEFAPSIAGNDPNATDVFQESAEPARAPKKAAKPEKADEIPETLGGYEVIKVLGKGGMGAVLLGRQVSLDRKVALKIMHARLAKDPGFVARFTREAYAAAQLVHHNVIQIYDIGEDRGTHFFSMEFVPGQSLMELVKEQGKLDAEVAVGYVLQAARGLRYGHLQGMVHRDIKPDNLMLNTEGIVKVADLGLVKLPTPDVPVSASAASADDDSDLNDDDDDGQTQRLTRAGAVMGTPSYMAPEQAVDSASVDQRADIYSLGCTLYVMVTGKTPFQGKTALEVISKHQTEALIPPEAIVKRVPKALSGILQKMLAKKPEHRYQSMDEVISAFEGFLGVSNSGPFTPKDEHATILESAIGKFNAASKGGLKTIAGLGFFAACILGVIGCGLAGKYLIAGGLLGLAIMTPLAYFIVSGLMSKSFLFGKVRQFVLGLRIADWLMWGGGAILFLLTLYIFGLLWYWLGFCVLAIGLAFVLWSLTDRTEGAAQLESTDNAKQLFKVMRLQGLDEESLRQFVCKYGGENWEPFYEAMFGYDAKIAARSYRKGAITEEAKKHATWREPILDWIDAKMRSRQEAKERTHLEKVQVKALEAKGISAKDAQEQAAEMADVMVAQANEAKAAEKAGKKPDLRAMLKVAKAAKRPREGYNIAGIKRRSGFVKDLLNDWLGRRLRILVGAAVFALGLLWLNQNKDNLKASLSGVDAAVSSLAKGELKAAGEASTATANEPKGMRPLELKVLPESIAKSVSHFGTPISGFLLILAGIAYYGWRPSLIALPGCLVGVFGPSLGIPDIGPLSAWMTSTAIAAVLILVVSRFLRS